MYNLKEVSTISTSFLLQNTNIIIKYITYREIRSKIVKQKCSHSMAQVRNKKMLYHRYILQWDFTKSVQSNQVHCEELKEQMLLSQCSLNNGPWDF